MSDTEPVGISREHRAAFRRKLLAWYKKHARELPWRENSDPYRVWVSEVMLQQTTVAAVKDYFLRFVDAFPDVTALAAADEQDVLRLWEGLGYYRRARMLHAAARKVVAEFDGRLPSTVDELMKLPGIGRYTAGAIVSIAFDKPAAILEANTLRLFARLLAIRDDATRASVQRQLWQAAEDLLPTKNVAYFNQGLMELGSLVCSPNTPNCVECPVNAWCASYQTGSVGSVGPTTKKVEYSDLNEAAVVIWNDSRVLMRQCQGEERWAGLWDFPRFAVESEGPLFAQRELKDKVKELTGVECEIEGHLKTIRHGVTRYRITLDCYSARRIGGRVRQAKWFRLDEIGELPLSVTGRKLARHLH